VAQEPEGSSPHSQQPATGPYPEPVESNAHPPSQSPESSHAFRWRQSRTEDCSLQSLGCQHILTHFQKMKMGLPNHKTLCLCLCVCHPLITFQPTGGFSGNLVGGAAIQDDLDAVIFSPIYSTILKWLGLKSF
jgi:hypothetical protein